ncbi:uncharacterized protein [Hetaerina americana]|uniref:uncharacterized protein isoform X1 n=1 Tax=Hetaerina americana TaxID=62018 RepID=UPI003A7F1B70
MDKIFANKMLVKVKSDSISPSAKLFCKEDGSPMAFNVLPSPDRDVIVQIIKDGGGAVVDGNDSTGTGAVRITSSSQNVDNFEELISSSYIYVSRFYDELVDMKEFRFIPDNGGSAQSVRKNGALCGIDYPVTTLSQKELHQVIMYILKCKDLWKEIDEKKVCGAKSWKAIQKTFAFWALEKFYSKTSSNMETLCGPSLQVSKHPLNSIPARTSTVIMDSELSEVMENETREVMQHESNKENCRLRSSNKILPEYSLLSKEVLCKKSRHELDAIEDISLSWKIKRAAVHRIAITDDSSLESEEEKGTLECIDGTSTHSDGRTISEKVKVDESKIEEKSRAHNLEGKNSDLGEVASQLEAEKTKSPLKVRRNRNFMRTNYSVACNEWLRKGGPGSECGRKGNACTSTPLSQSVCIQKNMDNSVEEEFCRSEYKSPNVVANGQKPAYHLRLYTYEEDMKLLKWICNKRKRSDDPLTGNRIWKFIESRGVLPGRSWQSMRERFRRHIAPNLKRYKIPKEDQLKLNHEIK